jgi:hypothetical protein
MRRGLDHEGVHAVAHRNEQVGGKRPEPEARWAWGALQGVDSLEVREHVRRGVVHREEEGPRDHAQDLRRRALLDQVHHRALQHVLHRDANFI